jgi:hypothetical protein
MSRRERQIVCASIQDDSRERGSQDFNLQTTSSTRTKWEHIFCNVTQDSLYGQDNSPVSAEARGRAPHARRGRRHVAGSPANAAGRCFRVRLYPCCPATGLPSGLMGARSRLAPRKWHALSARHGQAVPCWPCNPYQCEPSARRSMGDGGGRNLCWLGRRRGRGARCACHSRLYCDQAACLAFGSIGRAGLADPVERSGWVERREGTLAHRGAAILGTSARCPGTGGRFLGGGTVPGAGSSAGSLVGAL